MSWHSRSAPCYIALILLALIFSVQLSVADPGVRQPRNGNIKNILKKYVVDKEFIEDSEPFDLINLMYTMKWFIAHGTRQPYYSFSNDFPNSFNVFLIVLKLQDYLEIYMDKGDDVENLILQSLLFTRDTHIDRSLIRQHILFEELSRDINRFDPKEYIDIHRVFNEKYGYTISEYISTIIVLNSICINERTLEEVMGQTDWGIDPELYFDNTLMKDRALLVFDDLCVDPITLKNWAKSTLNNPYDFEPLLINPMFKSKKLAYPNSPGNMNAVIFDGLFFKIRNCFDLKDESFFRFFGRLFEHYISDLLKTAVDEAKINTYKFIEEFKYGRENKLSSDAYILLGKSLLIIECKSGRIRKETKIAADEITAKKDFQKFVINPIKQANKVYTEIIRLEPQIFEGVNKVFILSVSSHSFPKVPKFNNKISDKQWQKKLHSTIKQVDYLGILEIELIAYIIKNMDESIFKFIQTKKMYDEYIPYTNYYNQKYGEIKRMNNQNQKLKEVFENVKTTLGLKS
ncbi:hypothetical protein [Paenibacillus assamensis]|uniref:hypothetical protein n=1 Tax=Paenibacillus assamensis TaxID=311244 RepID=UPI00041EB541|nr:hypothetical protein [Paenibacillus assamensis]